MWKNILIFVCIFMFNGCNKVNQIVVVNEKPSNCFNPSDAVYKFKQTDAKTLMVAIRSFLSRGNRDFDEQDFMEIDHWIQNDVFSTKMSNEEILEWNINDPDFCISSPEMYGIDVNGDTSESVEINICNSVLNTNVIPESYWQFISKDRKLDISLTFCVNSSKWLGKAAYYEIREDRPERPDFELRAKYQANVDFYFTICTREDSFITQKIHSDDAFMYTAFQEKQSYKKKN